MDNGKNHLTNRKKGKAPERFSEFQVHGRKRRRTSPSKDTSSGIFPLDVWLLIADFIPTQDTQTLSVLTRVSRTLYQNLSPRLYRDLVFSAPSHSNVRGSIQLIERYLSISRAKFLQNEHRILDARTEYPEDCDEHLIPYCAQYVKRMLVGWSNPDPDNAAAMTSYIEEALQNLTKLEVLVWLDNHIQFTDVIGKRLAELKLKAFAFNFCSQRDPSSLADIKNLAYLDIFRIHDRGTPGGIKELLFGSKDTLETLIYEEGLVAKDTPIDSREILLHEGEIIKFPKLTTLCLRFNRLTGPETRGLLSSIDFTHLTYFEFSTSRHEDDDDTFSHYALFQALLDAYGPDSESSRLALRTFRFRSQFPVYPGTAFFSLLSSFDTLRTFIFEETRENTGDREMENLDGLISALSGHKNLQWLSIHIPSYAQKRWHVSKDHITRIRDSFPELSHLSCSYHRLDEDEFFSILPTIPKLASVTIPAVRLTLGYPSPDSQADLIKCGILLEFLRQLQNGCTDESKPRRWDDKYKLSMVMLGNIAYEIGSWLPRSPPGIRVEDQTHEVRTNDGVVFFRRIAPHQLFDGEFPDINFMKAAEWRARNYDATKGDWCQGIKL